MMSFVMDKGLEVWARWPLEALRHSTRVPQGIC